ncbi:MAG: hypothetical protein Q8R37_00825 [Nanoarchaeota archaeon]|nr:hypothetical protein [Nanoarchaeota archaeon]
MVSPQFITEKALSLADVQRIFNDVEKRDTQLNYLSHKAKESLAALTILSTDKKEELSKKLMGLNLTRLKDEHVMKIIDFLPLTMDELKVVLQAYPLSMPKKDQELIVALVKEFTP